MKKKLINEPSVFDVDFNILDTARHVGQLEIRRFADGRGRQQLAPDDDAVRLGRSVKIGVLIL